MKNNFQQSSRICSKSISVPVIYFICLFSLGVYLRVYNFWVPELWLDEYSTWWVVAGGWFDVIERAINVQSQSPFYYLIVKCMTDLFGASPLTLRLPSILFGVGILGLAYPLGLRLFQDKRAAQFVLAVFAINQLLIWYSQEARPYALALFCTMLSFVCYLSLLKRERWITRIGYVLATTCAYYAHFLFGFILLIQVIYLCIVHKWKLLQLRSWWWMLSVIIVCCLFGTSQLLTLINQRGILNYIPPAHWTELFVVGLQVFDPMIFSGIALMVLVLGCERNVMAMNRLMHKKLLILWFVLPLLFFGFIPPLVGVTLISQRGIHSIRYVLYILPAALCIISWLMAITNRGGWRSRVPIYVLIALYTFLNLLPTVLTERTFSYWPKEGFVEAADTLESDFKPGDFILYSSGYSDADLLADSTANPLHLSAKNWPLKINLKNPDNFMLHHLPYRLNQRTLNYYRTLMHGAGDHRRVWLIGMDGVVSSIAFKSFVDDLGYKGFMMKRYGAVHAILLEQDPSFKETISATGFNEEVVRARGN